METIEKTENYKFQMNCCILFVFLDPICYTPCHEQMRKSSSMLQILQTQFAHKTARKKFAKTCRRLKSLHLGGKKFTPPIGPPMKNNMGEHQAVISR
jgi:hypothetical protein